MRTAIFAAALLVGTTALAQDYNDVTTQQTVPPDTTVVPPPVETPDAQAGLSDTQTTTTMAPTVQTAQAAPLPTLVQPDNSNPERDARGIPVISDPATAPAGFNQQPAVGGPFVDAATGTTPEPATESYPPCTAEVTDNCLQTYERGRSPE